MERILEVEYIDGDARPLDFKMFDGSRITIGKNVQDFYFKLLELPVSHRCQLLNLEINELQKFIKERQNHYNKKLLSEFKKTWLWRIDGEIYDFQDSEVNNDLFEVFLNKKQIIGRLKRNTFDAETVFRMLAFFHNNDELKEEDFE